MIKYKKEGDLHGIDKDDRVIDDRQGMVNDGGCRELIDMAGRGWRRLSRGWGND